MSFNLWHFRGKQIGEKMSSPRRNVASADEAQRHNFSENLYAFATGCILVVLGLRLIEAAGLVTAGTAGIALMFSYATEAPVGLLFMLVNAPFLLFAAIKMGYAFALRAFAAITTISVSSAITAHAISIDFVHPALAAVAGGTAIGMGILSLVRHGVGVGGTGVAAIYLNKHRGWNVGLVSLAFDFLILASSGFVVPPAKILWSLVSIIAIHGVVFVWHRPGRYTGS